jgi:hypothetical protein
MTTRNQLDIPMTVRSRSQAKKAYRGSLAAFSHHEQKMSAEDEYEEVEKQYEPLVDRLRNLQWPEVPAEVRDRCWEEFQQIMHDAGLDEPNNSGHNGSAEDAQRRHSNGTGGQAERPE